MCHTPSGGDRNARLRPLLFARFALVLLTALAVARPLSGCSDVPANNPYDPATPEAQQAKGTVRGRLALAAPYTAAVFDGAAVELSQAAAPEVVAFEATPTPEGNTPEATFVLSKVPAGLYWLRVRLTGFDPIERLIEVTRGGDADVGTLSPAADAGATLVGQATLAGNALDAHAGIVVSALGTPFAALTAADGHFRMALAEGTYTLQASHAGYASAERAGVVVAAGAETRVPEPLVLNAAPGAVHLTIRLDPPVGMAERVVGVAVTLTAAAGGEPVRAAQPDAQGNVLLAPVPPGDYVVAATLAGFGTDTRSVAVSPDTVSEAGTITLAAAVEAVIRGTALLRGPAVISNQGILVTVDDLPATAITGPDGAFRLPVNLGVHTLRAHFPGYDDAVAENIAVEAVAELELPKTLELNPRPGAVRVSVQPEPDFADLSPDLTAAAVTLRLPEGGEPVAQAAPDASGNALLDAVSPGRYLLRATLPGFRPAERLVDVTPATAVDAGELILFAALDGLVTGTARLAGAADHSGIAVSSDRVPGVTFTDARGGFRLPVIAETHTLTFRREGYATVQRAGVIVAGGAVLALPEEVTLSGDPGVLAGTVALSADFDLPGTRQNIDVAVHTVDAAPDAPPLVQTNPAADGRYTLPGLAAARYRMTFSHVGFSTEVREAAVAVGQVVELSHVTLTAPGNNLLVQGRAELARQDHHSGIRVEIAGTGYFTETTDDGSWQIACVADLVAGRLLSFTRPGYSPVTQALPARPAPPAITLPEVAILNGEPGSIRGLVRIDEDFDDPGTMAQVVVHLSHFDGDTIVEDRTETPTEDGVFLFEALPSGSYLVDATLTNFVTDGEAAVVDLGSEIELRPLFLSPDDANRRGVLSGRVRLAGRPDGEHGGIRVETARRPYVTFTGADGDFELEALGGIHAIEFRYAGYGLQRLPAVEIPAQGRAELDADILLAGQPGRVLGTISLPAGFDDAARMLAVQVAAYDAQGEIVLSRSPAVSGDFVLGPLPSGDYTFEATLAGFRTERLPITLGPGESADVRQVLLTPEPVAAELVPHISGRVEREGAGDDEHGGIRVEVLGTPYVAVTNGEGRFEVTSLPEPSRLRFTAERYAPEERGPFDMAAVRNRDLEQDPQVGVVTLHGEPGRVRGVVALPAGFDASRFAQVSVQARQGAQVQAQVAPDASGLFVLPGLAAGAYDLSVALAGADPLVLPVTVEVGETHDVGRLELRVTRLEAGITGTAHLQGVADPRGHGGIRVESQGTPFTTVTTETGQFTLDVTPGPHTLVFSAAGYGRQTLAVGQVPAGPPALALGADVVLPAQPGAVTGQVSLARFGTVARLQGADVEVLNAGNARVALAHPAQDGRFSVPDLAAGAYTVRVAAVGYGAVARAVVVPVGTSVAAGSFDLPHKSTTPEAVLFAGRVRTGDGRDAAGTQVRLRIANPDQAFTTLATDAEGRFEVFVAPDENYRVSAHRAGYVDPVLNMNWRWDAVDARIESDQGACAQAPCFDVLLLAAPLEGRITATVRITPDWIPAEQQWVRATLRSDTYEAVLAQVTEAAPAVFARVPAGRYNVSFERPGFTTVQVPLTLDFEHPEINLPLLDVRLTSLVSAQLDLSGRTLDACELRRATVDFRGANLSGVTLTGDFSAAGGAACANCVQCAAFDFGSVDLTNADLSTVTSLAGVQLDHADLFGARLTRRNLRGANLRYAHLFGADLEGAALAGADLTGANLTSARAVGAIFVDPAEASPAVPCAAGGARPGVRLTGANFAQTDLTRAVLRGVNLDSAVLSSALLAEADLRFACLQNTTMSLTDLSRTQLDRADLTAAALTSSILYRTVARGAQFTGVSLTGAVIESADFGLLPNGAQACNPYPWQGAAGTTYDERCVGNTRFSDARCCRTELDQANLNGANLVGATLDGADLTGASLLGLTMGPVDGVPPNQPRACQPEIWNDCRDICLHWNTCIAALADSVLDCDLFVQDCERGLYDFSQGGLGGAIDTIHESASPGYRTCLAGGFAAQPLCQSFGLVFNACLNDPASFPARVAPCTWARISDPAANDECAPERIPEACAQRYTSLRGARLVGAEMTAVVLNAADVSDALMDGVSLRGADVFDSVLSGGSLVGADLSQVNMTYAGFGGDLNLTNANLTRADVTRAYLGGSNLTGARFYEAHLSGVDFSESYAEVPRDGGAAPANFRLADLHDASFYRAVLPGADLQNTNLQGVELDEAAFQGADFTRATSADFDVRCLDVTGAGLTEVTMPGFRLKAGQMRNATMTGGDLSNASFQGTDMAGVRISRVNLDGAGFGSRWECPFEGNPVTSSTCNGPDAAPAEECTSLVGAHLSALRLAGASLSGDFTDATLREVGGGGASLGGGKFLRAGFFNSHFSPRDYVPGMDPTGFSRDSWSDTLLTQSCPIQTDFVGVDFQASNDLTGMTLAANSPGCQRACMDEDGAPLADCVNALNACDGPPPAVGSFPLCARFIDTRLRSQTVNDLNLPHIAIELSDWRNVVLNRATLPYLVANNNDFGAASFIDSNLDGANFGGSNFVMAVFRRANLQRADFGSSNLGSADFFGVNLAGANLTSCGQNVQFNDDGVTHTDLTDARFTNVGRADMSNGNFTNATMTRAYLYSVWMPSSNLTGANATQANFQRANVDRATMRNMNLTGADVRTCNFQAATWGGSNFNGATICATDYTWLTAVGANRCVGCTNLASTSRVVCDLNCAAYTDPCP